MKVSRFMARQYARPSGAFGRLFVAPLLNKINAQSNAKVFEVLDLDDHSRVLEIGFGGGDLILKIPARVTGGVIHGLELSEQMICRVQARARSAGFTDRIHLHQGTVDSLPFLDRDFDRVCCVNTVYFWPDLERSFAEIARVMDEGGLLVLGFGSHTEMRDRGFDVAEFQLHTPEAVSLALENSGFSDKQCITLNRNKSRPFHIYVSAKAA